MKLGNRGLQWSLSSLQRNLQPNLYHSEQESISTTPAQAERLVSWLHFFPRHESHRKLYRHKLYIGASCKLSWLWSEVLHFDKMNKAMSGSTVSHHMTVNGNLNYFFQVLYQDQTATWVLQDSMIDGCILKCIKLMGKTWANLQKMSFK